ncbi:hypothetical protein D3C72_1764530 [compost metagenome]
MRVQDTGFTRNTVYGGVDEHGRGLDGVPARKFVALGVDQYDVIGLDFAPHETTRIQQEMVRVARQCHAEMVADPLTQTVGRRRA